MKLVLSIFLATFPFYNLAEVQKLSSMPDSLCLTQGGNDPFEQGFRVSDTAVRDARKCLDTSKYRPTKIIRNNEDSLVFANVFHQDQFWTAALAKNIKPKTVSLLLKKFNLMNNVMAAKVFFRVSFEHEIELIHQVQKDQASVTKEIIFSFDAAKPQKEVFNYAIGSLPNYSLTGRVLTKAQLLQENETLNPIEEYPFQATPQQKRSFFIQALKRSQNQGMQNFYNTLSPNGATEFFEIIDEVLYGAKRPEKFITMLSQDPVIGPSLKALKKRKLIPSNKGQVFFEGKNKEVSQKSKTPLFLSSKDYPFSYVTVLPEDKGQSKKLKKLIHDVGNTIHIGMPYLFQAMGSSLFVDKDMGIQLFEGILGEVMGTVLAQTRRWQNKIPLGESLHLGLHLTPWDHSQGEYQDPKDKGDVPFNLPFSAFKVSRGAAYHTMTEGYRTIFTAKDKDGNPATFLGMNLNVHFTQDSFKIHAQISTRLSPLKQTQAVRNEQVNLSELLIPKAEYEEDQSIAIVNFEVSSESVTPKVYIEFGPEWGIMTHQWRLSDVPQLEYDPLKIGTYRTYDGFSGCDHRALLVPKLIGVLGGKPMENDFVNSILRKNKVALNFFSVELDPINLVAKDVDVRLSTFPVNCMGMQSINEQVKGEINQMIKEQLKGINKNGNGSTLTDMVLEVLFSAQ